MGPGSNNDPPKRGNSAMTRGICLSSRCVQSLWYDVVLLVHIWSVNCSIEQALTVGCEDISQSLPSDKSSRFLQLTITTRIYLYNSVHLSKFLESGKIINPISAPPSLVFELGYYCDYCDTYLTHDSPSVRKQHNAGYKHKANVRTYYQQFEEQQTQSLIDQRIKEHLGQAAAFHQVGAAFNQHLMAQRPRLPILPTPVMPIPRGAPLPINQPMVPGIRPPVLPRPVPGAPGMPPTVAPPGATSFPGQINGLPQPPTLAAPSTVPFAM
ncbi:U1 small nuclear ribonucleoprotein C [Gossypium arboreum]|uniref:U1 small nuclear ribonucleoprotein C n=1 Tax=Gossypium arboreum TaxID=29729 RepID=A0A0B0NMF8_GOSAR|nr:U1 small nuclear ribonucleoprotein C [Gossypium arboreum]KHG20275.1 U1 small nuclear ribonucleoprotein C [Gossypium arboreum]